jgi:hypothetical protein
MCPLQQKAIESEQLWQDTTSNPTFWCVGEPVKAFAFHIVNLGLILAPAWSSSVVVLYLVNLLAIQAIVDQVVDQPI